MNILIKIGAISLIFILFSVILKHNRPEYVFLLRIFAVLIVFFLSSDYIASFIESFSTLFSYFEIESLHISLMIKVIGISLLTDFISDTLKDNGETAMANSVVVVSKMIILFLTIPVINGIVIFCLKLIDL